MQRTVEGFKYIDLEKYKVMNPAIPFKALLGQLLLRAVFPFFARGKSACLLMSQV